MAMTGSLWHGEQKPGLAAERSFRDWVGTVTRLHVTWLLPRRSRGLLIPGDSPGRFFKFCVPLLRSVFLYQSRPKLFRPLIPSSAQASTADPDDPPDLWPQLFSDVSCIALWISSEKILTRLYSVLHWFHKRLEANVKKPRENRCFQTVIVFSFSSFDNSNKCIVLLKIAASLITVSTSVNKEM